MKNTIIKKLIIVLIIVTLPNIVLGLSPNKVINVSNLLNHWAFNETSGTTAINYGVNGVNLNATIGFVWKNETGNGSFARVNSTHNMSAVSLNLRISLNTTRNVTFGGRIRWFDAGTGNTKITGVSSDRNYLIKKEGATTISYCSVHQSDGTFRQTTPSFIPINGTWYSWICTTERNYLRHYVNGVEIGNVTVTNTLGFEGTGNTIAQFPQPSNLIAGEYIDYQDIFIANQSVTPNMVLSLNSTLSPIINYSNVNISGSTSGTNVSHSFDWYASAGLSGYVFSWCNGTFVNITNFNPLYNTTDLTVTNATGSVTGGTTTFSSWNQAGTVASALEFTQMNNTNDVFAKRVGGGNNNNPYWRMMIQLDTSITYTEFNFTLKGRKELTAGTEVGTCYIANFSSLAWNSFGILTTTNAFYTFNLSNGINNHINSTTGIVAIQCIGALFDANENVSIDYFGLKTKYTTNSLVSCNVSNALLTNDSVVSFGGTLNYSNTSKRITSTVGSVVKWCYYANDTLGNLNSTSCQNPFSYVTTGADNTCTYGGVGDWLINCEDDCSLTSTDLLGNKVIIYGTTPFDVGITGFKNLYNYGNLSSITNCVVTG